MSLQKNAQYQKIQALDFSYIAKKMSSVHYELPRWPLALAETACQLYKNFLWLNYRYPQELLVPTRDMDECWHIHLLHTKAYEKDCQQIFGYYLHHAPSDPENEAAMLYTTQQYQKTKAYYEEEFSQILLVLKRDFL